MEPWRVCRPVVEDSQHFDESRVRIRIEVKSCSGSALKSEKLDPDLHLSDADPQPCVNG